MERKLLRILSLLSVVVFCLLPGQKVKADVHYKIENNTATAKINSDGSVSMERQIKYFFYDSANGVFYRQNLSKDQKLDDTRATIKVEGNPNTVRAIYGIDKTDKGYYFYVFHRVKAKKHFTVTYYYKITNAITNYHDIAELNYMIIGNGWDTSLDNVKASVIFPGPVKNLQAWAHGPLNGHIVVKPNKGKIVVTARNLDGHTGIEIHAIFPLKVTSKNKKVVKKNHRQTVLRQEAVLARRASVMRLTKIRTSVLLLLLFLFTGLLGIVLGFSVKKQGFKAKKMKKLVFNYAIPNVDPVTAQILDKTSKPDSRAFTAYIMQLAGKNRIKIEDYQEGRKTNYRLTVVDSSVLAENKLVETMFTDVGDQNTVTTKQLREYKGKVLGEEYVTWTQDQYGLVQNTGLLDEKLIQKQTAYFEIIILLMFLSAIVAYFIVVHNEYLKLPVIITEVIILLLNILAIVRSIMQISQYSQDGAQETNKVRGFKKMLTNIGRFKMRDVGDLTLWQDIMPYAVAFGLAKKVLKELKLEFGEEELQRNYSSSFMISGSSSFSDSFSSSFTNGISSGSSGSGDFSSGSSGGFGGGSGGGAF